MICFELGSVQLSLLNKHFEQLKYCFLIYNVLNSKPEGLLSFRRIFQFLNICILYFDFNIFNHNEGRIQNWERGFELNWIPEESELV
jgi:hypothetical protein